MPVLADTSQSSQRIGNECSRNRLRVNQNLSALNNFLWQGRLKARIAAKRSSSGSTTQIKHVFGGVPKAVVQIINCLVPVTHLPNAMIR